ncbi:alpha/beta fold hydrolase [Paeniglutamicibacter antarcticus]|uniref:Alpha/beta fold hydrolase n=1 Tax=Arthrobacter terrae TaxID=2935737 RepID=A0A931CS85_9MICC|nr:alpha/beta fold hydrolase [Arthrobacter terrae]MBG0740509.1 alpha/beta fold hydrolase [Arthrobacter terrae]
MTFSSSGHGPMARVGVALSHGFTGSPVSIQGWAEYLAAQGFAVSLPLLSGHGTSWQELARTPWIRWYQDFERAYLELTERCDVVFTAGLSMGGALALRVAEHHGVAGVAVVNPGLTFSDKRARYSRFLKYVLKSVPAIGDDIKLAGVSEGAYQRTPVAAVQQLAGLFKDTVAGLDRVKAPTIVFRSAVDRVVPESSMEVLAHGIGSTDFEVVRLENSYHVATMDNDAALIFERSAAFFREHSGGQ